MYNKPRPSSPIAATVKPIIDPPKKATDKLSLTPVFCAAVAVLTFAFVAVYIPINPVTEDVTAPTINATVLLKPNPRYIPKTSIRENTNKIEYSFFIKSHGTYVNLI